MSNDSVKDKSKVVWKHGFGGGSLMKATTFRRYHPPSPSSVSSEIMVLLGLRKGHCFPPAVVGVDLVIAFVDCVIAVLAFYKLLRIHSRSQQLGWTRQKVFHFLTGCSNFGYFVYFVLTLVATCNGWKFWSPYSFVLMASPEILFFTSFLLLLSFWIDLCHLANDEDEDEECSSCVTLLQSRPLVKLGSSNVDCQARCLPLHYFRVRSRQRIVVLAACLISVVMISVAVGIGVGGGTTYLELIPKIYVSLLAIVVLILGGALAYYGFLICSRMRRVRSESASSEMWKVGGLSVVSPLCFTTSSVIALLPDSPVLYRFQEQQSSNAYMIVLIILYYFVGLSVPSAFLLWVMRELPQAISPSVREEPATITFITDSSVSVQRPPQWTTALSSQNQMLRSSPI